MKAKDRKWLELIGMQRSGMYPGECCDMIPAPPAERLRRDGLIERFVPHNPAHKDRWTITNAGRAALKTA